MLRAMVFAVPVFVSQCQSCDPNPYDTLDDRSFVIRAGDHDSSPGGVKAMRTQTELDRWVTFRAYFHADAAYATTDPVNQWDWNKLMGLSAVDIHEDSIRLGWRYDPEADAIDLGFYGYRDGVRISEELTSVPLETWFEARLEMTEDHLYASVDGFAHEITPGPSGAAVRTTWVVASAYFGGDETAPHDIHIDVTDVRTDP